MADQKISALTAATTPLAGTEVVPLVQSGTTKKVAVSDLTAGRSVSMLSANVSSGAAFSNTRLSAGNNTGAPVAWGIVSVENCGALAPPSSAGLNFGWNYSNGSGENNIAYGISVGGAPRLRFSSWNGASLVDTLELMANNDVKVSTQNIVQGTAAKGVNFTANTPAAGMTSQLLNWYEEGTFTATLTATTPPTTPPTATARYTRVGRLVTVHIDLSNVDTSGASGDYSITGLPFTSANNGVSTVGAMNSYNFSSDMGCGFLQPNSTTILIVSPYAASITTTAAGAGKYVRVTMSYIV